jgi:hypothetical protein
MPMRAARFLFYVGPPLQSDLDILKVWSSLFTLLPARSPSCRDTYGASVLAPILSTHLAGRNLPIAH